MKQNALHLFFKQKRFDLIFKYYSSTHFKLVDIGISTENSVPNYGLCDYKKDIGCKCSVKNIWEIFI